MRYLSIRSLPDAADDAQRESRMITSRRDALHQTFATTLPAFIGGAAALPVQPANADVMNKIASTPSPAGIIQGSNEATLKTETGGTVQQLRRH